MLWPRSPVLKGETVLGEQANQKAQHEEADGTAGGRTRESHPNGKRQAVSRTHHRRSGDGHGSPRTGPTCQ
jgi:hypothetical protein